MELVLPGANYLVRMLDGRIDTQGAVKDLRSQGLLEGIAQDEAVEVLKEELVLADKSMENAPTSDSGQPVSATKKPKKLIKDEHRETGGVKWSIYKSYLKASWVPIFLLLLTIIMLL